MTTAVNAHTDKRYPVKFKAPNQAQVPDTDRSLDTYVHDWLTVEEFNRMMPGQNIIQYMSYEALGPDDWGVRITPDEVLSCERNRAAQTIFINAVRSHYLSQAELAPDDVSKIARDYDDISPATVLFLLHVMEILISPVDNFDPPPVLEGEELKKAVNLMVEQGVRYHDLLKPGHLEGTPE